MEKVAANSYLQSQADLHITNVMTVSMGMLLMCQRLAMLRSEGLE